MDASIWSGALSEFRDRVASTDPGPAGGAASAGSASAGLSLLIKSLEIVGRRKNFSGDAARLRAWIEAAKGLSEDLAQAADADIARGVSAQAAVEIPLRAARCAAAGLDLCAEAAGVVSGAIAADLAVGALLLGAAVQAILL